MRPFRSISVAVITMALASFCAGREPAKPGATERGFLLPSGWTVSPAGRQVVLSDLPLNILPLAGNRYALVATSGFNTHELTLIELETGKVVSRVPVNESWFGLATSQRQDKVWWSGGGGNQTHAFTLAGTTLTRLGAAEPPLVRTRGPKKLNFRSGLVIDQKAQTLFWLDIEAGTITATDLAGKLPDRTTQIGGRPYDVAIAPGGLRLYVSDWAGRRLLAISTFDLRVVGHIGVGEHPNQIVVHPKDKRMFVACASTNEVCVIDTARGIVTERISTSLFPRAPEGSTPDALAIEPDGRKLYVANADNNCIAVVDISQETRSQVQGFIPTGWYPTAVACTPDGKHLLVGVGKGNLTRANPPSAPAPPAAGVGVRARLPYPYIGNTLSGALSIVPLPDESKLAAYTETVYRNCPYSDKLLAGTPHAIKTAIPTKVGGPSPIKYVIYIIKENRTYDQVFGDLKRGNGDPSLVLFGREVTPNHHKLAEEFVLLDNLYCNGHVSADGHPWSTMAYSTDYVARNWALTYSKRSGISDDDEDNLTNAPSGYLWDACGRLGISYRSYGEYGRRVSDPDGGFRVEAKVPGLVGHICPNYGAPPKQGQPWRDTDNAEVFLKEFRKFEAAGAVPRFIVMSLGEDHTFGTKPEAFTPQSCVASNDLALGRIVEGLTRSKLWPEMAIFVIEDDAQNGPDHVDAHRTVGFVISPYVKRRHLDSTQYTTVSMLRTIELILGIPPLSQFDAAAQPMFASFTDRADLAPYTHEKARIDLNVKNRRDAYGAARSSRMDFAEYDRIDDFELNEILWRAIKGANAPVPPPVRRAIAYRAADKKALATDEHR